ncbi:hypothetical protein QUA30_14555 [Microcoleus sp. Pol14C2]|uniref:hypothetical protein n=1 Tax=unclassified Microcoleus TaxID=2642155 RepID=UPI002FD48FCE
MSKTSYREVRSHRAPQQKSKKSSLFRNTQPDGYSRQQQQQLSRARFNRDAP